MADPVRDVHSMQEVPTLLGVLPWLLGLALPGWAEAPHEARDCLRIEGETRHGESFVRELGRGLSLYLLPSPEPNPPGWTLEIGPSQAPASPGFVYVVTPPYRFSNPRDLTMGYGHSAAAVVGMSTRRFHFVTRQADHDRALDAVRKLLWSADVSAVEQDAARRTLAIVPKGDGVMRITGWRIAPAAAIGGDRIDWLRFEVELCWPAQAP